jgi:hypothetical protein
MYKNTTKTFARELIWKTAINRLTTERNYSTIVTEKNVYLYWNHLTKFLNNDKIKILDLDKQENVVKTFLDFRKKYVSSKAVNELKVLFFCGPEPENDIDYLLTCGILEENIWVVESDKINFISAVNIIKHCYPSVKIYQTKIENLFSVINIKYDIVYLDYTAPFFSKEQKPYKTTIELFNNNIIDDFGVLITNYSELPEEKNNLDSYIKVLKEYFYYQSAVPEIGGLPPSSYHEIPYANNTDDFIDIIKDDYKTAYSYFLTHFHIYLAEIITPACNIFNNLSIKKLLFDQTILKEYLKKTNNMNLNDADEFIDFGDKIMEPENYWFEYFLENIKNINPAFHNYLKNAKTDEHIESINLLKNMCYDNKLLNKDTFTFLESAQANLIDPKGGYFCDVPMLHLWIALIVNQLGGPYHVNLKLHKRFSYIGSKREMYVDIFTLDKCRYFYDWIPSYNTLPEIMLIVGKQLLIRSIIDIIRKQNHLYLFDESYQYGNIICYNDDGADFIERTHIPLRERIVAPSKENEEPFIEMFSIANSLASKIEENYYKSFSSFINFHPTYTSHAFVWLTIKKVPKEFSVFGKNFIKYNIKDRFNFQYYPNLRQVSYKTKYSLNGSEKMDVLIHKTIKTIFARYGLECELKIHLD